MILDLLYPRDCAVCGAVLPFGRNHVCPDCNRKLSYVSQPVCLLCGKEIEDERELCRDCAVRDRQFSGGAALLNYNGAAKQMMAGLKYENRRSCVEFLAWEMARRHGRQLLRLKPDALVPVPVHAARRRERGYNQAELLAKALGKNLGLPVKNLLIRASNTAAQNKLGYGARQKNEKQAFRAAASCEAYDCLILVDDIYTTGATAENCTEALLAAGAGRVFLANMAITMK